MASVGQAMAAGRRNGRVKFFNSQKGYGFIIPHHQDSGENIEIFVHHTAIHNDGGFKSLGEGEEVEYDLMPGPKGMQAANVTGPGGVSVKGDPNAGRRDPFGGYGGVQAQPGNISLIGYMQSYGQGFQTGQQRATGQQYPLGGGQQFPGQQPGGSQSANSYNMYGGSPYVYSPPSYGQPYAAASQSGYSASGQSSGGTFNPQAYQGAGYPGQPGGGAGGGVSTGGGGGGSGYQPYYQQGSTPSQGQGFFYTPQGSGPTNGNLPQQ